MAGILRVVRHALGVSTVPSRLCPGPADGDPPCPTRTLVAARPGSKQASRCPPCQAQWQANRGTTTQRGYGTQHRQLRAQVIATYDPTDLCWRCLEPLGPDPTVLDLGHTDDRLGYMGLEHAACSRGHRLPTW
jgi:hypothetical protein